MQIKEGNMPDNDYMTLDNNYNIVSALKVQIEPMKYLIQVATS